MSIIERYYVTNVAEKILQSVMSIRPSVFTLSFKPTDLFWSWFLLVVGHDCSSPGIETEGHRSRSKVDAEMCVLHESVHCGVPWVLIDGRSSRFHRDVISCDLARRGVRRGAAEVSSSGGVQHVWAWQRSRSDRSAYRRLHSTWRYAYDTSCRSPDIAAATYRSRLRISTACRIFLILTTDRKMPANAPSPGGSWLPPNTWLRGLTWVHTANGISIGSAVSVGLAVVTNSHTQRHSRPPALWSLNTKRSMVTLMLLCVCA